MEIKNIGAPPEADTDVWTALPDRKRFDFAHTDAYLEHHT